MSGTASNLESRLHTAAKEGRLEDVKEVIEKEPSLLNARNEEGYTPLQLAARNGHLNIMEHLIEKDASLLNAKDHQGWTLLYEAAENGHLNIAEYLIGKDASLLSEKGNYGWTPLHEAAESGHLNIVEYFTGKDASLLNAKNDHGCTPLHLAAESGHLSIMKYFIGKDASLLNEKGFFERTPLHPAAENGHLDIAEYLIGKDASLLNEKDDRGRTPLHEAAENGHLDIVEYLTGKDASLLNAKDNGRWTPLHLAAENGHLNIMEYFTGKDASLLNEKGYLERTPLHLAARNGHLNIVEYLTGKDASLLNAKDHHGSTPLHEAAENGHLNVAEYLIGKDASLLNEKGFYGRTPLYLAASEGHLNVVEYLTGKDASLLNAKESDGQTLLHKAAEKGHLNIVEYLIGKDASLLNAKESDGRTPLHLAAENGHLNIVEYLIRKKNLLLKETDRYQRTPLHLAVENGHLNIVEYLTGKDASLVNEDEWNSAPLPNQREVCRIPVENKADVEATDYNLWTPLHFAVRSKELKVIKYLFEIEADVNAPDLDGNTPCHLAAIKGQIESLKVLLPRMRGNLRNGHNQTVYDLIREKHANSEDFKKHSEFLQESERSKGPPVLLERLPEAVKLNYEHLRFDKEDVNLEKLTTPEEAGEILRELKDKKLEDKEEYLKTLLERFAHPQIHLIEDGHPGCSVAFRVQNFVKYLLEEAAKIDIRFAGTLELVGSSADGTKVGKPDEFDFLLLIEGLGNLKTEFDVYGRVRVWMTDDDALDRWKDSLEENNELSLGRIRKHFINLMWETSRSLKSLEKFDFSFSKVASPDVAKYSAFFRSTPLVPLVREMKVGCTLRLHCQTTGLTIDVDLVPTIKIQGWPRHPKILPYEELRKVEPASIKDEEISFCVVSLGTSFPTAEKMILSHCEESLLKALRIVKVLFHLAKARNKEYDYENFYAVKTGFLRYLASRKDTDTDTILETIRKILASCRESRENVSFFTARKTKRSSIEKFVDFVEDLINN